MKHVNSWSGWGQDKISYIELYVDMELTRLAMPAYLKVESYHMIVHGSYDEVILKVGHSC